MGENSPNSQHLDQIITCIKQNQLQSHNQPISLPPPSSFSTVSHPQQPSLQSVMSQAAAMLQGFQSKIDRCKRYNEAKINRKYESLIQELENHLHKLTTKLKIEQDARSPTKKHITEILDQLVIYKQENQKLRKQVGELTTKVAELEARVEDQVEAIRELHNNNRGIVERLPPINPGNTIFQSLKSYLSSKQILHKVASMHPQPTSFEKHLHQILPKSWSWSMSNLLESIEEWSEGIKKPKGQVDMWKIRSSVARSFSEVLDDSGRLVRPSSFAAPPKVRLQPLVSSTSESVNGGNRVNSRLSLLDKSVEKERRKGGNRRSEVDYSLGQ